MRWLTQFLVSSIGKKLIMSLTGLFLITFLTVHLIGNLQLLIPDGGEAFNIYADFMSNNPLIKFVSIGLYAGIILHAIQGILLALENKRAKGKKYAVSTLENGTWMSKNMALLGTLILFFLCVHMGDFWFKIRFTDQIPPVEYAGMDNAIQNVFYRIDAAFSNIYIVIIYLIGLVALALHLIHGFQSAFTSLGLQHKKYTPLIKLLGLGYSVTIPLLYAIIPLFMYFSKLSQY